GGGAGALGWRRMPGRAPPARARPHALAARVAPASGSPDLVRASEAAAARAPTHAGRNRAGATSRAHTELGRYRAPGAGRSGNKSCGGIAVAIGPHQADRPRGVRLDVL